MGASWASETGKSLTFSILKRFEKVGVQSQYGINLVVSLGVMKALSEFSVPGLAVKWPNDIMSDSQKICGVLIEPQLRGAQLQNVIIGIGLNVNNAGFDPGLNATSMLLATGRKFDIEHVLGVIAKQVLDDLGDFSEDDLDQWKATYEKALFRRNQVAAYQLPDGSRINGMIRGIDSQGLLIVEHESGNLVTYGLKEIKMLF